MVEDREGGLETEERIVNRLEDRGGGLKEGGYWEHGREQRGGLRD